jgi:primosomal protein N' (replication factor Y)
VSDESNNSAPVARVRVDLPIRHLDRDFDYLVPEQWSDLAVPGARVRVRFSGRLRDAYVLARSDTADVDKPRPIERVVDAIPPLTDETLDLVRQTANRYVGSFWDVVRAAVPARHARAEKSVLDKRDALESEVEPHSAPSTESVPERDPRIWDGYHWPESVAEPKRLVWSSAPASDFASEVTDLALGTLATGRGVVVVVPDASDLERVHERLLAVLGKPEIAVLSADHGAERRYREFLRARLGLARVVLGTRNAVFAPVADLGALIVWDDGDDVYREPHAPYWDAREVAALRAHLTDCELYVGGPARSVATQWWCRSKWAQSIEPVRPPWWKVQAIDDREVARDPAAASARIPTAAWQIAHEALSRGPVLFQVLRRGYVPVLACQECRAPATCAVADCGGGLFATSGHAVPQCIRCGALAGNWVCQQCGSRRLRAVAVGAGRTAEELGKAFPGVPVVWSEAERIVREVPDRPAVVVATPGAQPWAAGGYAAVVLLDARFAPVTLSGSEQQVRRWFSAVSLVREGGRVCIVSEADVPSVQSLIRYDSRWFADRQIDERSAVGLPPVTRVAELTGPAAGVSGVVTGLGVPHKVLGPVPLSGSAEAGRRGEVRSYVVVPRSRGASLTAELDQAIRRASMGDDSMREVRVRMDPRDM